MNRATAKLRSGLTATENGDCGRQWMKTTAEIATPRNACMYESLAMPLTSRRECAA